MDRNVLTNLFCHNALFFLGFAKMPRASRIVRVSRYLRALPRFLWNEYPEQVNFSFI